MIRLAVIGSTSNGKTYLLSDMIESFNKLGYKCVRSLGGAIYPDSYDFYQKMEGNNGEVQTTPVVQVRRYNEYRSTFASENRRSFEIGFLDIPGEIFQHGKIERFWKIIRCLYDMGKYFRYDVYRREDDKVKVLRFVGPRKDQPESDEYKKIIDAYVRTGYDLDNGIREKIGCNMVSGKMIVNGFFDYDTDSVVDAIAQAIPFFKQGADITQSTFINTGVGMELFYFFYCLYATDVILCDKFVLPYGIEGPQSDAQRKESPVTELMALYAIKEFNPRNKNYYLAFRGADALIKDALEDLKRREMSCNDIYALIIYLIEYKLTGTNVIPFPDADEQKRSEFVEYLGKNVTDYLLTCKSVSYVSCPMDGFVNKHLKDFYDVLPYYGMSDSDAFLGGEDLTQALKHRILQSINDFQRITGLLPAKTQELFMAPNVFLTSSAVADEAHDYKVTGNDPKSIRRMQEPTNRPANRACFGTLQLAMSLLQRNKVSFDYEPIALIDNYIC